jgi:hypothetical protein
VPPCPVVVWQVALESAFATQELLVRVYEVAVPYEEICLGSQPSNS